MRIIIPHDLARHTHGCVPGEYGSTEQRDAVATAFVPEWLAVPEIAFVLLASGLLCLTVRVATPALGWPGAAAGMTLILLGIAGLAALPVAVGGVLMLGFSAASLVMEVLHLPGFGLHAAGAAVSLILAGIYLTEPVPSAHPVLVAPIALTVGALSFLAGRRSWRYIRDRPLHPSSTLLGRGTVILSTTGESGLGVVAGQIWNLRAEHGDLEPGQTVRVTRVAGDDLIVKPTPSLDIW